MESTANEMSVSENKKLTEKEAIGMLRERNVYFAADDGAGNEPNLVDVVAFLDFVEMLKKKNGSRET